MTLESLTLTVEKIYLFSTGVQSNLAISVGYSISPFCSQLNLTTVRYDGLKSCPS